MEKFLAICVIFSAMFISLTYAEYASLSDYDAAEHLDLCLNEMKLSRDDFVKMLEDEDEKSMCVFACVNRKMNTYDGSKFNAPLIHQIIEENVMEKNMNYHEFKDKVTMCIEAANKATGDDCEKNGALMACLFEIKGLIQIDEE